MAKAKRPMAAVPGTGRPMRWPTNDRLCRCARTFLENYNQDFLSRLRRDTAHGLRSILPTSLGEDIFLLHDGSTADGRAGFFFCQFGIISKLTHKDGMHLTSWLSFVTGRLLSLNAEDVCRLQNSLGIIRPIAVWGEDTVSGPEVHHFLEALQTYLRTCCGGSETIDRPVTVKLPEGVSEEMLARCAREFIIGYDQSILSDIRRGDLVLMRSCLGIPAGTEIFLYHDDTECESGKSGFVIAFSGFYCRTWCEGETAVTGWRTFFTSTLEAGPYVLKLSNLDAPLAVSAVGRGSDETFSFIAQLHAHLRGQFGT